MGRKGEVAIIRRRQDDMATGLDSAPGVATAISPSRLVKVFAESTLPTARLKYFACHPVKITGTEAEGSTPTFTADTSQTLYVAVIGPRFPVAGRHLVARLADGRWVSDDRSPPPPTTTVVGSIKGCFNVGIDATYTISLGGTPVASGSVTAPAASGFSKAISIAGNDTVTITVTPSSARLTTLTQTFAITAGTTNNVGTLNPAPAGGFICCSPCALPLSVNLLLDGCALPADVPLTYNGTTGWVGSSAGTTYLFDTDSDLHVNGGAAQVRPSTNCTTFEFVRGSCAFRIREA